MFSLACSRVCKTLLLQVLDVDIQQAAKAYAVVEDFARCLGVCMHFEHFLISGDNGGDAAHIDDPLANTLDIESLAAQQEDYFITKLFLNRHTAFFGLSTWRSLLRHSAWLNCRRYAAGCVVRPGCYRRIWGARLASHIAPNTLEDGAKSLA